MKLLIKLFIPFLLVSCGNSDYLAKVDNQKITAEQFTAYLEYKGVRSQDLTQQHNLLKQYAQGIGLYQAILKEKSVDNTLIDEEVESFRRSLIINKYFENTINTKVTEDSVKNYYANHAADYEEERAHVAHILIRTNPSMTEEEIQHAKTKIYEVYSKLQSGVTFSELAEQHSNDSISAKKEGDIGWIKRGAISSVFSQTAFSLEENTYSEPIQTEYGFHIIKLLEPAKVIKKSFNEVKGEIRHQLKAQIKSAELERLLAGVKITIKQDDK